MFKQKAASSAASASGSANTSPIVRFYDPKIHDQDARGRTLLDMIEWDDAMLERCHDYIQVLFPLPEGSMFSWNAPIIDEKTADSFHSRAELRFNFHRTAFRRMMKFYGFDVHIETTPSQSKVLSDRGEEAAELHPVKRKVISDEPGVEGQSPSKKEKGEDVTEDAEVQTMPSAQGHPKDGKDEATQKSVEDTSKKPAEDVTELEAYTAMTKCILTPTENFLTAAQNWAVSMDHNHLRISRILRCLRVLGLKLECKSFYLTLTEVHNSPLFYIGGTSMMYWQRAANQPLHIAPDGTIVPWLKKYNEESSGVSDCLLYKLLRLVQMFW